MSGIRFALRAAQAGALLFVLGGALPAHADERFAPSADGQEVLDKTTNLSWARCADGMTWDGMTCKGKVVKYDFKGAKVQVAALAKSSGKEWRIPTKDELLALVLKGKKKPWIDQVAFPNTPSDEFWATKPGFDDNLNAWLVSFKNGKVSANLNERKFPLRLVRNNKS